MSPVVTTQTTDSFGQVVSKSTEYLVTERVRGGIYIGGNADWRTDFAGVNMRSFGGYHSLAEQGAAIYPGQTWRSDLVAQGLLYNLIVELKWYGAGTTVVGQNFTVEGKSYAVPAPNGRIQRRANTQFPVAWSYDQVNAKQCDGLLHRLLVELRKVPAGGRVNVQFASEVDTDNEFGTSAGTSTVYDKLASDQRAAQAYAYMINWMRTPPAGIAKLGSNITFSVGWAGAWSGFDSFARLHPETMPIDYMQWNVYDKTGSKSPYDRLMEMTSFYRQLGPKMRSKPIIIAEWGANKSNPGGQAPYIQGWPAALRRVNAEQLLRGEGQIVATNYFNSNTAEWGLLDPKAAGITAIKVAYSTPPMR